MKIQGLFSCPSLMKLQEKSAKVKKNTPKFLIRLHEILESGVNKDSIIWSSNGNQIHIVDATKLAEFVLPNYFKHNNYATFIRQLNIYGFHKGKLNGQDIFAHPMFLRGRADLLLHIERNCRKKPKTDKQDSSEEDKFSSANSHSDSSAGSRKSCDIFYLLKSEMKRLHEQQCELDTKLKLASYSSELQDMSFQMSVNQSFHKEQSQNVGNIILTLLNKYLKYEMGQLEALPLEDVAYINKVVHNWIETQDSLVKASERTIKKCFVVYKFFSSFNLKCLRITDEKRKELEISCVAFFEWLKKFVSKNRIFFPHLETLILRLIFCVGTQPQCDLADKPCIAHLKNAVSGMLTENDDDEIVPFRTVKRKGDCERCSPMIEADQEDQKEIDVVQSMFENQPIKIM